MNIISPGQLQTLLHAQPDLYLVDVRTPVEFAEVHVTQARSVPLDEFKPQALIDRGLAARDRPVYLLCRSGARATKAAEKLEQAGFSHATVVDGGTLAWIAAGLPVERGSVKVISLERQVRIAAGALVLVGVLLGWFYERAFFGLAGFVGAGLIFAGVTDYCGMGLLLAKLPWNKRKPS